MGPVIVGFALGGDEAVRAAGFSLSKPYLLKIFDIHLQSKATYGDYAGACKLLAQPQTNLPNTFSEKEIASLVSSKVEMMVLALLQERAGSKKFNTNSAAGQALNTNVLAFCNGAGEKASSFAEMAGQLEIVYCVVAADSVPVKRLKKALEELSSMQIAAKEGVGQGVLMEFFLASGGMELMEAAEAISKERTAELENDNVLASLGTTWKASLLKAEETGTSCMPSFFELHDKALSLKGKKSHEGGFSKIQVKDLDTVLKDAGGTAAKNVANDLRKRLEQALKRHEASLLDEGYVNCGGLKGPLRISAQMELMAPAAVFDAKFGMSFLALCARDPVLKDWKKMTCVIASAMAQASSSMKAYKPEDSTPLFDFEAVQSVERWLVDSDLVSVCGAQWKSLFARCLACDHERLEKGATLMLSIVTELLEGRGANLDKAACDQVLSALPPNSGMTQCLAEFFEFVRTYVALMATPDSAKTASLIASVQRWCETYMAPCHEQDLKMGNFDFGTPGKLKEFAEIVLEKMGGVSDANKKRVMQELKKKLKRRARW